MSLEYDGISELLKAAPKRLADARELLETPTRNPQGSDAATRHLRAAVYLAGYALECALKVYIIDRTDARLRRRGNRVQGWSEALRQRELAGDEPDLSGSRSHSLELLFRATDLSNMTPPGSEIHGVWVRCMKNWRPSLRYAPDHMRDRDEARATVDALEEAYKWVRNIQGV